MRQRNVRACALVCACATNRTQCVGCARATAAWRTWAKCLWERALCINTIACSKALALTSSRLGQRAQGAGSRCQSISSAVAWRDKGGC